MTFARELGAFAASLAVAGLPPDVDREARRCVLDTLGVAIAGARHPMLEAVSRTAREIYGAGACRTVVASCDLTPAGAAFVNGTAAHAWDFDDTCYAGIVHASAVVLPAITALAQSRNSTYGDLRAAFVAGVETIYALGDSLGNAVYFDGWWTTGLFGSIGAAAGAARILGLDAHACATAIAHAATAAAGLRAVLGTAAKPLGCGHAARLGVESASLAAAGLDAPLDIFEHRFGFAATRGRKLAPIPLPHKVWRMLSPGAARKIFPACSAVQAAGEAFLELKREYAIEAEAITAIECATTRLVVESLIFERPETAAQAQFSIQAALACLIDTDRFGVKELAEKAWQAPRAGVQLNKIRMSHEPRLFDEVSEPEGAEVTVFLANGERLRRRLPIATGTPGRPMTDEQQAKKFADCATPSLGAEGAEALRLHVLQGDGTMRWRQEAPAKKI
jgi:2-methylcitrate dehydratase PrpD